MTQTLRGSLAYDRRLPWGLLATAEALVTRNISDFVFVNLNLIGPQGIDRRGRVLYGTFRPDGTGVAEPAVRSSFSEVIDLRTIRPMDIAAVVKSVKKTNRCVTVEEAWPQCSVGTEIAAQVMTHAFDHLGAPVVRVNGKDVPMPYAANLEKLALPSVDDVVQAAKSVLYV